MSWELATLAGLRPLGHFDLQYVRVDEVLCGHAKASARDLFDGAAAVVAVRVGGETRRVLAALAGVGLSADAVHGDGERLVSLLRDRAERHRARDEALDDLLRRLDLLYGDRCLLEVEEAAQGGEARAVLVEVPRELLEGLEAPCLDGALEGRDAHLVPLVVLALCPELIFSPDLKLLRVVFDRGEGAPVALQRLARQRIHPDAAHTRGRAREVLVDQ